MFGRVGIPRGAELASLFRESASAAGTPRVLSCLPQPQGRTSSSRDNCARQRKLRLRDFLARAALLSGDRELVRSAAIGCFPCAMSLACTLLYHRLTFITLASHDLMQNCWVFFRDVFGSWQWERHGDGMVAVEASDAPFDDARACRHDAIRRGYQPTMDAAIFPPEFEQVTSARASSRP